MCDRAGLVASEIVAIDGTKFHANASREANVDYDQIAREVIAGVIATDEAEDEIYGDQRGDELPEELQTAAGRRAWLARELARDQVPDSAIKTGVIFTATTAGLLVSSLSAARLARYPQRTLIRAGFVGPAG